MKMKFGHAVKFLHCLLLVWNFKSLNLILSLWYFFKSSAVGSTVEKVRIRFLDLNLILKVDGRSLKVVELGAGSSTIFFLSQKQVSSLMTLEENAQYLPEVKSKNYRVKSSPSLKTASEEKGEPDIRVLNLFLKLLT